MLRAESGKQVEVMVYGDGAFKDPVGNIWELADPVVSPAYTDGAGRPARTNSKLEVPCRQRTCSAEAREQAAEDAVREGHPRQEPPA